MDVRPHRQRLIEYLYRVAVEPGRYDELMECWEQVLNSAIGNDDEVFSDAELERHVLQACEILERLEQSEEPPPPLSRTVALDPNPAMLLAGDGRILLANDSAVQQLGVHNGGHIGDWMCERAALAPLLCTLADYHENPAGPGECFIGLVKVRTLMKNEPVLLALSAVRCTEVPRTAALLTTMAPVWNPRLAQALCRHFGLTAAEADLIKGLVQGLNLAQIAEQRCRSIHTIRTQMKSVLRKTGVDSQVELVRLAGFMGRYEAERHSPRSTAETCRIVGEERYEALHLRDGLRMEFATLGPEDGQPVLFVHGMLDMMGLTSAGRDHLYRRHIRLVAPVRPSFAGSDPDPHGEEAAPERFALQAGELLDHLGIGRVVAMGHMAGSMYAFAAAAHLKDRIAGIVNVAGGVPILSLRQFAIMAPRQRLIAMTTRHAPHLLPLFLKAGIALIRSGGENAFLNALYRGAPVDHEVAMRPEVRAILNEGYNFTIAQGQRAFHVDALHITSNWSRFVEHSSCPVTLVHGVHDPVVRIDTVRDFAHRLNGRCRLVESHRSGQLVLFNEPELVFDNLEDMLVSQGLR